MDDATDTLPPPVLTKKPWAGRDVKKLETPQKNESALKRIFQAERRAYRANPKKFRDEVLQEREDLRALIPHEIAMGYVTVAELSGDPELVRMQREIDAMAKLFPQVQTPPKLLIHASDAAHEFAGSSHINASATLPEFIDMNEYTAHYFRKHPDQFKAVIAHEMAHIILGDLAPDAVIAYNTTVPNQLREVLCERMAAIVHGNPQEYARATAEFLLHVAQYENVEPFCYSLQNLSAYGNVRMLEKWSEILERAGAINGNGDVILDKALQLYERSKGHAEDMLALEMKSCRQPARR